MRIRSGPATVQACGTVTAFGGQPLVFELEIADDPFRVELAFASQPAHDDVAVHTEHLEAGFRFLLVNFDGADGRGSAVPVLLGEVGDVLLFLHFRVFRYGRTDDRTVHYTFYTTSKDEVGWQPA